MQTLSQKQDRSFIDKNFVLLTLLNKNYTTDYVMVYITNQKHEPIGQLNIAKALNSLKKRKLSLQNIDLWSNPDLDYLPSRKDLLSSTYTIETVNCIYNTRDSRKLWRKLNAAAKALSKKELIAFK